MSYDCIYIILYIFIILYYIILQCIVYHYYYHHHYYDYIRENYITLHYVTLQYIILYFIILYYIMLYYIILHPFRCNLHFGTLVAQRMRNKNAENLQPFSETEKAHEQCQFPWKMVVFHVGDQVATGDASPSLKVVNLGKIARCFGDWGWACDLVNKNVFTTTLSKNCYLGIFVPDGLFTFGGFL